MPRFRTHRAFHGHLTKASVTFLNIEVNLPFYQTFGRFVFLAHRDLKPYYCNDTKVGLISVDFTCPLFAGGNIDRLS